MFENYPEIMSVQQVAQALDIGLKAAYTLINTKTIGHIKVGRSIKIPRICLIEFVESAQNNKCCDC